MLSLFLIVFRHFLLFSILISVSSLIFAAGGRTDYDLDDDGLIEIDDWADLDEIRNNLDGKSLYGVSAGCPAAGCEGFELSTSLDFDTNQDGIIDSNDAYWNSGEGWIPIGDATNQFLAAQFDGNGFFIDNLYINSNLQFVGLFGVIADADIRNLKLTGELMQINGLTVNSTAGAVAGVAVSVRMSNTFATGHVGGNTALSGGLIGLAVDGEISKSFFIGSVQAGTYAGGLIGQSPSFTISNSFSTGFVTVNTGRGGGLIGDSLTLTVTDSFSTAMVSANFGGGLIGYTGNASTITNSYWAMDASKQGVSHSSNSANGYLGETLANMQCSTEPSNTTCSTATLYDNWDSDVWEFGADTMLPGLKFQDRVYRDADSDGELDELDTDNDGIGNSTDTDDDGDGVSDTADIFPLDRSETIDTDNDGLGNNADTDDDGDGTPDVTDDLPLDDSETLDTDNDGLGNNADADDDGDGVLDTTDGFPLDGSETIDTDNDGLGNNADSDDDSDGTPDASDTFPLDASETIDTDNDGLGNNADTDDDDDGTPDASDAFPLDNSETTDTDNDGFGNNADTDDDGDGTPDASDAFPLDGSETIDTDSDGIGNNADTDDDGDGVPDATDAFPLDGSETLDTDSDGIGNNTDTNDDGDGVPDATDAFPLDSSETIDTDSDGIGNNADIDDDGDGVPDATDAFPLDGRETIDTDSDGIGNNTDTNDDGDGVPDATDAFPLDGSETIDTDSDGIGNNADIDDDGDGIPDATDAFPLDGSETIDTDSDGIGNNTDINDDGDGVPDAADAFPLDDSETLDTDSDGIGNNADIDDDGDGVPDNDDAFPLDSTGSSLDDDVDVDNNGLIEIRSLTDLSAMRHELSGRNLAGVTAGCPDTGCNGYELMVDLSFDTNQDGVLDAMDDYWNGGQGWEPIGTDLEPFEARFQGHGNVIRHLYIDRPLATGVGLFGALQNTTVSKLGLEGNLTGYDKVGLLAGSASHSIVQRVYTLGQVNATQTAAGLIGYLDTGSVTNSYNQATVTGAMGSRLIAGLVADVRDSDVKNSYSTGVVTGDTETGGLVAYAHNVTSSGLYWDSELSSQSHSAIGDGYTSVELKCAQSVDDSNCTTRFYSTWDSSIWDFGTDEQYPVLIFKGAAARGSDVDSVLNETTNSDPIVDGFSGAVSPVWLLVLLTGLLLRREEKLT